MAVEIGALRALLSLDSAAFESGAKRAQASMGRLQRSLTQASEKMRRVGRDMSLRVTAPTVAFFGLAVKSAGDFEASMNKVAAVSGATASELARLERVARDLGASTQFSATEAADGLTFLAQAGFSAAEAAEALPGVLDLAAAGSMDLATTADIASNILSGYRLEVGDLAAVNDVLAATFTSTNTNLQQLGDAMSFVGPVAAAAGANFEEVSAAIGLLGNAGIQGEMAGTSLRGAMTKILNPTKQAAARMDELGISFTDAQGKIRPLAVVLDELAPHADDAGLFMELFGQRAGPAMAALVGQGSGALRDLTLELENAGGTADRIAKQQMQGFNGAMKRLQSAFEGLQIALADSGLIDTLTGFVERLATLIQRIAEADPKLVRMGVVVAGVGAALGPVLITLGLFTAAVAAIATPVGLVVTGIAALTAGVVAFWPEINRAKDALIEFGTQGIDWIKDKFEELLDFFRELPTRMFEIGKDMISGLIEGIKSRTPNLGAEAAAAGRGAETAARRALETQSPSKVFMRIGQDLMDGLGLGIDARAQRAAKSAAEAAKRVTDAVSNFAPDLSKISTTFDNIQDGLKSWASNLSGHFNGLITDGKKFGDVLKGIGRQIESSAWQQLFSGIGGGLFGGGGGAKKGLLGLGGFLGFLDGGGNIGPGQWAVAGERGPEIVTGPANVTSRAETARMMQRGSSLPVQVHITAYTDPSVILEVTGPQAVEISQRVASASAQQQQRGWGGQAETYQARGTTG